MKFIIKRYLLSAASLFILTQFIPAIKIEDGWPGLFYASFLVSILFYVIQPLINLVMLPLNLLTLNLSSWLIQIILFYVWTIITSNVEISTWQFPGISFEAITLSAFNLVKWQVTVVAALAFIITNKVLNWIFK